LTLLSLYHSPVVLICIRAVIN